MVSPHLRMSSAHLIGMGQLDLTIQPSRAQERRVQGIGPGKTLRAEKLMVSRYPLVNIQKTIEND